LYGNDIIEDVKDQRSDCLSSEELAESPFAQGDDFTDECTEKEEDLLDGLGSGVEEFEDEGDFGYATEATEDFDSDALHESTPTNYYDLLLNCAIHEQIQCKFKLNSAAFSFQVKMKYK
jgi:hypothetical protein